MKLVNMYDDGGGCSGKDAAVSKKKYQRERWGLRLDGGVHKTSFYCILRILFGTYNQIVILLLVLVPDSCDIQKAGGAGWKCQEGRNLPRPPSQFGIG